jgi:hypothetical protein
MISPKILWPAAILLVAAPLPAWASLTTFVGEDIVATPTSAHPNATSAAASFDTAVAGLGGGSLVDFESAPLGSFSSLTIAPGVTLSGTDFFGHNQTIRNTTNFPPAPQLDGFNTTASGANFVEVQGGTLTFTFSTAVDAFGAYFSGVQNFVNDVITFSDGTSQSLLIPNAGTSNSVGAVVFAGFTDPGKQISSITINAGNSGFDDIGVDDARFASTTPGVPEPAAWALMLLGFGGIGAAIRNRRASARARLA